MRPSPRSEPIRPLAVLGARQVVETKNGTPWELDFLLMSEEKKSAIDLMIASTEVQRRVGENVRLADLSRDSLYWYVRGLILDKLVVARDGRRKVSLFEVSESVKKDPFFEGAFADGNVKYLTAEPDPGFDGLTFRQEREKVREKQRVIAEAITNAWNDIVESLSDGV